MRIEEIFRAEHGRILATLIRLLGDFDVAEEALQEAFAVAVEQWPVAGTPTNPASSRPPGSRMPFFASTR